MNRDAVLALTPKQVRMLEAGTFHFYSGRADLDNHEQAGALERLGLINIEVNQGSQEAAYNCTITDAGRAALRARIQP